MTGAFVAAVLGTRGSVGFALAVWTVAWAEVVTASLLLSLPHWLRGAMQPVGWSLLEPVENRALWGVERWEAQAAKAHPNHDGPLAFRSFAKRIPPEATVAAGEVGRG